MQIIVFLGTRSTSMFKFMFKLNFELLLCLIPRVQGKKKKIIDEVRLESLNWMCQLKLTYH